MDLQTFRKQVYDNWRDAEGQCNGCQLRDGDLHPEARPQFGAFNFNADVMLVNETPGFIRSKSEYANGRRRRLYRDTPEEAFDGYDGAIPKDPYDSPDATISSVATDNEEIVQHKYGKSFFEKDSWDSLDLLQKRLFSDKGGPLPISLSETYYTNGVKCPKVGSETRSDNQTKDGENIADCNENGRVNCTEYLGREIEYVEPEVIVAGSQSSILAAADALGIELTSGTPKRLICSSDNPGPEYGVIDSHIPIIPSFQFSSGIMQNAYHIRDEFLPERQHNEVHSWDYYCWKLAERLAYELGIELTHSEEWYRK